VIIIVYSATAANTIEQSLGMPEYSYYFVLKSYLPILRRLGVVVAVTDPAREVDAIYHNAREHGEDCVFFSFTPPHYTQLDLDCPTIPVFAWEFETIPTETWNDEPNHDWRRVFANTGRAITHSNFTVASVRAAMGADFPIVSIPSPMWDNSAKLHDSQSPRPATAPVELNAAVVDTRNLDLRPYSRLLPPAPAVAADDIAPIERVLIEGVIYTSVFNPEDGRKNWFDMVCAFCLAFRDTEDATLVLKLTHHETMVTATHMLYIFYRLTPFRCRIILVRGYLSNEDYDNLISSSTYVVNTANGEGQCLPLMEFMSAGKPAIASRHSAMLDYINGDNAFVVNATLDVTSWPHDPRKAFRTTCHRVDVESLMKQYAESYRVAKTDPERYAMMSTNAHEAMRSHCSQAVAFERLHDFLISSKIPGF
jgi:glycosyltransferase involved in cell wall biosynthesis